MISKDQKQHSLQTTPQQTPVCWYVVKYVVVKTWRKYHKDDKIRVNKWKGICI